jgi:hypothetical protein
MLTDEPGLQASASSGALAVEIRLCGGDLDREVDALQPALAEILSDERAIGELPPVDPVVQLLGQARRR